MATKAYYQLLQQLTVKNKREMAWRSQITLALNELRTQLAQELGVEGLHYNNGTRRYVEVLAPSGRPFHISAHDVVTLMGDTPIAQVSIVVALEYDGGITTCSCPIWARCEHQQVAFRVAHYQGQWAKTLSTITKLMHKALLGSLLKH
ncbi:hypothetical protein K6U44_02220 [Vibrio parahaemolyticus]|uniref:hypothetical protein n=1 Tax=Vibrio parahaemolyticus TaxID=670 RepID=UPI001EEAEA0C|nr:hypothetical protein [Vibrio parahaemolyticus]MCG6459284.1 hypothetical protein [Vibrio parahaemolyticus]